MPIEKVMKTVWKVNDEEFNSYNEALKADKNHQDLILQALSKVKGPLSGIHVWAVYSEGAVNPGEPPARVLEYLQGEAHKVAEYAVVNVKGYVGYECGEIRHIQWKNVS